MANMGEAINYLNGGAGTSGAPATVTITRT
jgi:hypothetical protein